MRKHHILYIVIAIVVIALSFINLINVSALGYQTKTGVSFTFEPTLSINLSSNDLVISNLVPGSSSDSNSINVSVATNAAYGYTLLANTNNESLIHNNNINTFSSIPPSANLESLTIDNTWGYSTSLDNGSSWNNYNGLFSSTSNTTSTLVDTNYQTEDTIGFKIGAKAGSTQPSGIYTNTINFTAIAKPTPETITDLEYLQDFAYISPTDLNSVKNSMPMNYTYILKDQRDEQEYTIAKLSDNKIWMTKNLNLVGGTEITSELSDVSEGYILPTANGFLEGNRLPVSSQEGFSNSKQAYVYNSNNNTDNCSNPGCYSYYSWNAVTVGSGTNLASNNTDAPYSICPKGWRLPTSRSYTSTESDFYNLATAYGMNPNNISDTSADTGDIFHETAGIGTVPNFIMGDIHYYNSFIESGGGYYWSSTIKNNSRAYSLLYTSFMVSTANDGTQAYGHSARCLAR